MRTSFISLAAPTFLFLYACASAGCAAPTSDASDAEPTASSTAALRATRSTGSSTSWMTFSRSLMLPGQA